MSPIVLSYSFKYTFNNYNRLLVMVTNARAGAFLDFAFFSGERGLVLCPLLSTIFQLRFWLPVGGSGKNFSAYFLLVISMGSSTL